VNVSYAEFTLCLLENGDDGISDGPELASAVGCRTGRGRVALRIASTREPWDGGRLAALPSL